MNSKDSRQYTYVYFCIVKRWWTILKVLHSSEIGYEEGADIKAKAFIMLCYIPVGFWKNGENSYVKKCTSAWYTSHHENHTHTIQFWLRICGYCINAKIIQDNYIIINKKKIYFKSKFCS